MIKVSENSRKMVTRGREGYIESMSAGKTPWERVCERPPMESETTRKRLMYTLIKDINCIQILGWDHDICSSRKERSLIHETSRFYRI